MTQEQKVLDNLFQNFLSQLDLDNADYFASDEIEVDSVTKCFATINGDKLRYVKNRNLRKDIYSIVIARHKELWQELHDFKILD